MKLQGNVGHMESQFDLFGYYVTISPFGDCGNVDARLYTFCAECTIGSEIILDAPNSTPR
jgi:hypothetical protein